MLLNSSFSFPFFFSLIVVLVVGFSVHEFAHAWTADYFGDDTPRIYGRLTLNPLAHIDPLGGLMLLVFGFGWAKPVPVNPYALQRNDARAPMLVALAGPVSNLALALMAALPIIFGLISPAPPGRVLPSLYSLLVIFILFNLILFFFNLVPLFPLDGEKVAIELLPAGGRAALERARQYGPLPLMLIVFLAPRIGLPVLNWLVFLPAQKIVELILP